MCFIAVSEVVELAGFVEQFDLVRPRTAHLRHNSGSNLVVESQKDQISTLSDSSITALQVADCILSKSIHLCSLLR